jgi:hypothetical protein
MTLASIAGALIVLYVGSDSFLKLSRGTPEDRARTAEKAVEIGLRVLKNHPELVAKVKVNQPLFDLLKSKFSNLPVASARPILAVPVPRAADDNFNLGDGPKRDTARVPAQPAVQPAPRVWPFAQIISAPAPPPPSQARIIFPRRAPTPAEEALAVYRKYATPL